MVSHHTNNNTFVLYCVKTAPNVPELSILSGLKSNINITKDREVNMGGLSCRLFYYALSALSAYQCLHRLCLRPNISETHPGGATAFQIVRFFNRHGVKTI